MTGQLKEVFSIYENDRRQQGGASFIVVMTKEDHAAMHETAKLDIERKVGADMSALEYRRIVAVDFDGTLAVTKFPEIIKPIPKMIRHCKMLQKDGAILILYTCRKGQDLQDAVEWCARYELVFDYVNENTAENIANYGNTDTRKIFAHEYIDDKAINPIREAMWARRIRQLYAQRIISAVGLAAVLVIAIEAVLAITRYFK